MLKKFAKSLEDPQAPLLGPNIWLLTKIGLLQPKSFSGKVFYMFFHEMYTLFVLSQYVELYFIKSDLELVLTNLRVSMLSLIIFLKKFNLIFWQKEWKELISYVTEADKFERDTCNSTRARIVHTYTNYCRKYVYCYWILVALTFFVVVSIPVITVCQKNFSEALDETAEFSHMFSSWMPFDINQNPGMTITVAWHTFICGLGGLTIISYDSIVIVIMVFFGGKLDLLRERCKHMLGSDGVGVSDEEAVEAVKELHTIHVLLTKNFRLFNSLLSPVVFTYVVGCSILLCASVYQLTSATTTGEKAVLLQFFIFCIVQLFTLCWHSNDVLVKSGDAMLGPYESQWWCAGLRQRRYVLLLAGQMRQQYVFKAGPFTNLTLSTLINILKGAYSYYTLVTK